jgi:hypothetical protein
MKAHRFVRRRGSHIFYTISSQMAVRLSVLPAGRSLPSRWFLVLISIRDWVKHRTIVRLEGLYQLKRPMTSGIESATFRLVAKCLYRIKVKNKQTKTNFVALARKRTLPTERPPLVCEVSANFCGQRVSCGPRNGSPRPYYLFSIPENKS